METALSKLQNEHGEMYHTMVGGLDGKPGVMQNLLKVMQDLYDKGGIKERTDDWQTWKIKAMGAWAAVVGLFGLWEWIKGFNHPK